MTTLTATFDAGHGFVRLVAAGVPAGHYVFRVSPGIPGYGDRIPNAPYTGHDGDIVAADTLAPLGATVIYAVRALDGSVESARAAITTPSNRAFIRHLFYPAKALPVRVTKFDDRRPARLTTYAISGQRNATTTYDVRAGRDAELVIAVASRTERDVLESILDDGAPVSFVMCEGLGVTPGIWAVGDVSFARFGTRDRWLVTLPLTEVDMPRILAVLPETLIPGDSYNDKQAETNWGTYNDAAARWPSYAAAMAT